MFFNVDSSASKCWHYIFFSLFLMFPVCITDTKIGSRSLPLFEKGFLVKRPTMLGNDIKTQCTDIWTPEREVSFSLQIARAKRRKCGNVLWIIINSCGLFSFFLLFSLEPVTVVPSYCFNRLNFKLQLLLSDLVWLMNQLWYMKHYLSKLRFWSRTESPV